MSKLIIFMFQTFRLAGQEHFYLETQCCVAVPKENGEMEIFSATQCPMGLQYNVRKSA